MTFFLDENIPKSVATFLESEHHSVIDFRGTDKEGLADEQIFTHAQEVSAIFLTTDRDFYHTVHLRRKPHAGIVVITLSRPNSKEILEKVKWFLYSSSQIDIRSKCLLIKDTKANLFP